MGPNIASIVLIFIINYSFSYVLNHKCCSTLSPMSLSTSILLSNNRYNRMISYHASKTTSISATASGSGRGKKVKVDSDSVDNKEKFKVVDIEDSNNLKKGKVDTDKLKKVEVVSDKLKKVEVISDKLKKVEGVSDKMKKVEVVSDKLKKVEVDIDNNEDITDKVDNVNKDVSQHCNMSYRLCNILMS